MLLKQSRAVYLDRVHRVVRGDSLCEHLPLYDALERNAYMLLWENGLRHAPAGHLRPAVCRRALRDGLALRTRRLCGRARAEDATAINKDEWNTTHVDYVLRDYRGEHFTEAIADVGAMAALERTTVLSNRALCAHVSQLFARASGGLTAGRWPSRGRTERECADNACAFLREHFD